MKEFFKKHLKATIIGGTVLLLLIIALIITLIITGQKKSKATFKTQNIIENMSDEELLTFASENNYPKYNKKMNTLKIENKDEKIICAGSASSYDDAKSLAGTKVAVIDATSPIIYEEKEEKNYYIFKSKNISTSNSSIESNFRKIIVFKDKYFSISQTNIKKLNFKLSTDKVKDQMDLMLFLNTNNNDYYKNYYYLNSFIENQDKSYLYTYYYVIVDTVYDMSSTKSITYISLCKSQSSIDKESGVVSDLRVTELKKIY